MVRNRLSKTAVLAAGIAISTCAATRAEAQGVAPPAFTPAPVAASSSSSIGWPVIVLGAGVVSVIGYAIHISVTQHRELTSREAMTAIFLPFIGPAILATKLPDRYLQKERSTGITTFHRDASEPEPPWGFLDGTGGCVRPPCRKSR